MGGDPSCKENLPTGQEGGRATILPCPFPAQGEEQGGMTWPNPSCCLGWRMTGGEGRKGLEEKKGFFWVKRGFKVN